MWMDFAYMNPSVVVRMGVTAVSRSQGGHDGVFTWTADTIGSPSRSAKRLPPVAGVAAAVAAALADGNVILSADGSVFMSTGGTPRISTDHGATWKDVTGLPAGLNPIADRSNPTKFYALDAAAHRMYLSTDGGATFTNAYEVTGLPAAAGGGGERGGRGGGGGGANGRGWRQGGRPLVCGTSALPFDRWRPDLQGNSQPSADRRVEVPSFRSALAKPRRARTIPPFLSSIGGGSAAAGIYRSDDEGATWVRINDAQHQ